MGSEWPTLSLKEAGVQLIDCDHKTPKAQESGFPYIGIPQMKEGNIDFDANPRLISQSDLVTWTKKAKPQTNDVILSRRCNSGETVHVASRTDFALGQNLVILRSVGERMFPPYLRWVVRSPQWWAEVGKYLNPGAIFESLKCADIPKFKVPVPPLPEQKAIAHILGSLDDKIELNRRMNATLEGMAQALFKSWFVDFDPVIDNALAAGNPIPDELADRARLRQGYAGQAEVRRQALKSNKNPMSAVASAKAGFPAAFQQTGSMGWIPKGWEPGRLSDLLEIKYGKDHKMLNKGNIPVYGSGGLMRYADKSIYSGESVLIPRKGTLSNILYLNEEFWTVDTMFYTIPKIQNAPKYSFYHLKSLDFASMNVGSAVPSMTTKVLNELPIVVPAENVLQQFDRILTSYFLKTVANNKQIQTLTKLRDTLLPKLISGELSVTATLEERALAT